MSTAVTHVSFSGLSTDHRLEIAILDTIGASDDVVPSVLLFLWMI